MHQRALGISTLHSAHPSSWCHIKSAIIHFIGPAIFAFLPQQKGIPRSFVLIYRVYKNSYEWWDTLYKNARARLLFITTWKETWNYHSQRRNMNSALKLSACRLQQYVWKRGTGTWILKISGIYAWFSQKFRKMTINIEQFSVTASQYIQSTHWRNIEKINISIMKTSIIILVILSCATMAAYGASYNHHGSGSSRVSFPSHHDTNHGHHGSTYTAPRCETHYRKVATTEYNQEYKIDCHDVPHQICDLKKKYQCHYVYGKKVCQDKYVKDCHTHYKKSCDKHLVQVPHTVYKTVPVQNCYWPSVVIDTQ
jgi:hypothetical protein